MLSNIAIAAQKESAMEMRELLKDLAGSSIEFRHSESNETVASRMIRIDHGHTMLGMPYIRFNPDLWHRYPLEGATQTSEPYLEARAPFSRDGVLQMPITEKPATFDQYGIASPEQNLIHELGRYAMQLQSYQKKEQAASEQPLSAQERKSLVLEAVKLEALGNDHGYITRTFENPAMQSAVDGYQPRSAPHYDAFIPLPGEQQAPPEVPESERKALDNALKLHGGQAAAPDQTTAAAPLHQALMGYPPEAQRIIMARVMQHAENHPPDRDIEL